MIQGRPEQVPVSRMGEHEPKVLTIFHFRRRDGSALFLHPFSDPKCLLKLIEETDIEGRYGREPDFRAFTLFRAEIYRLIDHALRREVSRSRVVPHLVASVGLFAITFLFVAFVVGAPFTLLEEVGIGVGAAALGFLSLDRLDAGKQSVERRREHIRDRVDHIRFQCDVFVLAVESALDSVDSELSYATARSLAEGSGIRPNAERKRVARQLVAYLDRLFTGRGSRKPERFISRIGTHHGSPATRTSVLTRFARRGRVDFPLYVLYKRMKAVFDGAE